MKRLIRINGEPVEALGNANIVEIEPGVYSVLSGGNSWEARVSGDEITILGQQFRFEIEDPRQWKPSGGSTDAFGRSSVVASMPGKVVRLLVSTGDEVTAGQGIVVVEAMKMQNELKAPRSGRVSSINVREHDSVNAGAVLATIM
jgi:biotin carboxyl carrier protein